MRKRTLNRSARLPLLLASVLCMALLLSLLSACTVLPAATENTGSAGGSVTTEPDTMSGSLATTGTDNTEGGSDGVTYALTVDDPDQLLLERPQARYRAGETVALKVTILMHADVVVTVNGVPLSFEEIHDKSVARGLAHYNLFSFVMPAEDVTVVLRVSGGI